MLAKFYRSFFPHYLFFYLMFLISTPSFSLPLDIEYKDLSNLPRIALIIGNSDYKHGALENATHDANDFATALLNLGFKKENVMVGLNLNKKHTRHMLREFSEKLKKNASVGIFFYAGHGSQYLNEDYIIPINADISTEDEINDEAVKVDDILEKMEDVGKDRLNIVILDACRNNPFPRNFKRSLGGTGLAGVEAPIGSLIAYATGKGMVASDGGGRNGLFTKHLLLNMKKPGLGLSEIFSRTRTGVMRESKNKQRPWEQTATTGEFFFTQQNINNFPPLKVATIAPIDKMVIPKKPSAIRKITQDDWVEPVTNMEFVWIPSSPSCFMMGSPTEELGRDLDEKQHRVCLENGFWMGKYEVTQTQWPVIMKNFPNPSESSSVFYQTENFPVESVSWDDVQNFITKLNALADEKYRLPTEAEWEYAARANTKSPFYTGHCISDSQANSLSQYDYNYCGGKGGDPAEQPNAVGEFQPNAFGLYDMAGNVLEWTCSAYDKNYSGKEVECALPNGSHYRAVRGGSWSHLTKYLRSAARFRYNRDQRSSTTGFRLVRVK